LVAIVNFSLKKMMMMMMMMLIMITISRRSPELTEQNIISPPGIAMPPASLCFAYVTFFLMSPF